MSVIARRAFCARILVVDDSIFDRRLISLALKKSGFNNILTADNGEDALKKTFDFRPDLVLLDLRMPNLDGFGYIEMVRNNDKLSRMPIIVQTAQPDRQSWLRALSCGADDFLSKPLDMEEVALRICVQVERYFVLKEMVDTHEYLKMEIDVCHDLLKEFEASGVLPFPKMSILYKHHEVLEQIVKCGTYN
ncbi:MAG: response regulator [Alphaproteobacteria bacterium]|nr:response regulator [Alphaproteobacteria bacterium]